VEVPLKAIAIEPDNPDRRMRWQEVPDCDFGPEEVLVAVHATAVNRADLLQRAGQYPPPPGAPPYLGLEMAGVVVTVGSRAGQWQPGDRVCALLAGGGYAESVAVHHQLLFRLPETWDFARAAAVPEVFYTAFVNLFLEAQAQPGEVVLIHGGASGVGTAAIQLARQAGCRVLTTAGSQAKLECCARLGAELTVNHRERGFAEAVLEHCEAVDVILDIGGAGYLERNLRLLAPRGRLVLLALLQGSSACVDLGLLMRKRLRLIGSVLRSRPLAEKLAVTAQFRAQVWLLLAEGRVAPVIHAVLPITQADEAHRILEENRNIGKVVLLVRP
jgi:putative PIG3 family NAD(P)H quinone oxidoreductase